MIQTLTIIDNFFEDPEPIRQFAQSLDFTNPPVFDGVKYEGFCRIQDDKALAFLEKELSEAFGTSVSIKAAAAVASTKDMRTQQWIHADNTCAKMAAVVYLFKGQLGFGTAMWMHKETGASTLTKLVENWGSTDMGDLSVNIQEQGKTADAWVMTDYCESFYNRVVVYPTDRFHSRMPEEGFGESPEDCRLTISIFFDILP